MRQILLLLKTPPPYGGGEIRAAAMGDFVAGEADFAVFKMSSARRNKATQNLFACWKITEFLGVWWSLVRLLARERPALVYCSLAKSFVPFLRDSVLIATARLLGVRVAAELAGATFYFLGRGRIRTLYGRLVLRQLACLRVLGDGIARELASFGITNTIVTDNGVRIEPVFSDCSGPATGPVRLLFVGTHSPPKGFDRLVQACIELDERGVDFEVHTIGEWISEPFRQEMMSKLNDSRLEKRFVLHGLCHGAEKWRVFAGSQVLVLPSRIEGQPLVILEALASGLPIVATSVGAVPDTITDGVHGFLVEPDDAAGLTATLETLISDDVLRQQISARNRQLYEERFTEEAFLATQTAWLRACARGSLRPQGQRYCRHSQEVFTS